jgi:hypothetical protein
LKNLFSFLLEAKASIVDIKPQIYNKMDFNLEKKAQQNALPSSVVDSPLFKLLPELRNMICRYASISNRRGHDTLVRNQSLIF